MLYYTEICSSPYEVPDEISLCIYISGCRNRCQHCHYPELQFHDYGLPLLENFFNLTSAYISQITCVCFLGEGRNTSLKHEEFSRCVEYVHFLNLKACLYSGRDIFPEEWMEIFDYVKVGGYRQDLGDLFCRNTNQRLYVKRRGEYVDVTSNFWKQLN